MAIEIKSKAQLKAVLYNLFNPLINNGKIRRDVVSALIATATQNLLLPDYHGARKGEKLKARTGGIRPAKQGGIRK